MRRQATASLLHLASLMGCTARAGHPVESKTADPADLAALVRGNNGFSFKLLDRLRGRAGNLIVSPFSIETAFAMTYAGARGATAEQMARVFGFPKGEALPKDVAALVAELEAKGDPKAPTVRIANALWGQQGFHFLEPFLSTLRSDYGAALNAVDFQGSGTREQARQAINTWVEKKTEGKIKDLIGPNDLNDQTRFVLTNAIYFLGKWESPFPKPATRDEPFTLDGGGKVDVKMMNRIGEYRYAEA